MDDLQPEDLYSIGLAEKLKHHQRQVAGFIIMLAVATLLLGCLFLIGSSSSPVIRLVQVAGFIAMGYLHVKNLKGYLSILNDKEQVVYSLVLAGVSLILLAVLLAIIKHFQIAALIGGACAFLLPYILEEAWQLFTAIPTGGEAVAWYYSENIPLRQSTVFLNSMPIKFKVKDNDSGAERNIAFRAPVKMRLGLIFYHMIKEQNENGRTTINFIDAKGAPYGWVFFSPNIVGVTKYLNPEATLIENGIMPNRLIIASQLSTKALPEPTAQTKKRSNNSV